MFVHRVTYDVKGHLEEAAAIATEFWRERFPPPHAIRILSSWLFPNSAIVVEHEFESLAEYQEYWSEFRVPNAEIAAWLAENAERMEAAFGEEPSFQEMWEVR